MTCNEAQHFIDLRVHAANEAADPAKDWSSLDAHLSACSSCAANYRELLHARERLAGLSSDQPTAKEIDSMMAALAAPNVTIPKFASRRSGNRLRLQVLTGLATAAVLGLAFDLGSRRFGGGKRSPLAAVRNAIVGAYGRRDGGVFSNVDASLPTGSAEANATVNERERGGWNAAYNLSAAAGPAPTTTLEARDLTGFRRGDTLASPLGELGERHAAAAPPPAAPPPAPQIVGAKDPSAQDARKEKSQTELWREVKAGNITVDQFLAPSESEEAPAAGPKMGQSVPRLTPEQLAQANQKAAQTQNAAPTTPAPAAPSAPRPAAKLIKTGELALEVPAYESAVARVETIAAAHGGVIADVVTQEQPGGALTGRIVIRCPPDAFEALFAALKPLGRVESENAKAADVTAEYVDLEARILGLQITEERLQDLVKNKSIVDKVSSLLEVERELTRARSQVEQLQGQLRVMADRVALSTISVTLREPGRTVPSASLSVEVPVLHEAVESLGRSLETLGGRLVSGDTTTQNTGSLMGTYQLQVSLRNFAALQAAIEHLGRVEQRQVKDRDFSAHSAAAVQPAAEDLDRVKCSIALALFERARQLPSAQLRVEVDNVEDSVKSLSSVLTDANGAILSNRATRQTDGSTVAELKLRVPAGKFAPLLDAVTPLGRTTHKQVNGETGAIVGGAASSPCEISLTLAERTREVPTGTMTIEVSRFNDAREALSKLVADKNAQVLGSTSSQRPDGTWTGQFRLGIKSVDMEAVVSTLERLGRVTGRQLNGLGLGDLSRIAPDTVGSVALTLAEPSAINPSPDQAGGTLRGRLRAALEALYDSLGLIVYGLIVLAPWLAIVILVAWFNVRIFSRIRRGRSIVSSVAPTP